MVHSAGKGRGATGATVSGLASRISKRRSPACWSVSRCLRVEGSGRNSSKEAMTDIENTFIVLFCQQNPAYLLWASQSYSVSSIHSF